MPDRVAELENAESSTRNEGVLKCIIHSLLLEMQMVRPLWKVVLHFP